MSRPNRAVFVAWVALIALNLLWPTFSAGDLRGTLLDESMWTSLLMQAARTAVLAGY